MTKNKFADCTTLEAVLWRFKRQTSGASARGTDSVNRLEAEALARIRELTPPTTVSEEAREQARTEARKWWDEPCGHNPDSYNHPDVLADRIIDALGYTPAPPKLICTCGEFETIVCEKHPEPAPPPVVDLAPDELRWLAAVVEDYEKLYDDASRVVDDDTLPPMFYLHLRDSRQSVRVVCGENCWVLRIGGDQ